MDVDDWMGFSRHFTHLKDGAEAKDRTLLLSAILGDAINLGLTKMAESSPGLTLRQAVRCKPAHPRRNLFGGLGRAGQPPVSPRLCRPLGRRHDLILRWPALPRGWPGESTGTSTRSTVASRDGCSIPISPTSTRRSAPAW